MGTQGPGRIPEVERGGGVVEVQCFASGVERAHAGERKPGVKAGSFIERHSETASCGDAFDGCFRFRMVRNMLAEGSDDAKLRGRRAGRVGDQEPRPKTAAVGDL